MVCPRSGCVLLQRRCCAALLSALLRRWVWAAEVACLRSELAGERAGGLALELGELLLAVHLDDERRHQNEEGSAGDPRRVARRPAGVTRRRPGLFVDEVNDRMPPT